MVPRAKPPSALGANQHLSRGISGGSEVGVAKYAGPVIFLVVPKLFPVSLSPAILEIARRDNDHVVLAHANVMLLLWLGTPSPSTCAAIYDLAVELAGNCGTGKVSSLSIVQPGSSPPSPEARKALARLHDDPQGVIHRSALVFPNDGFVGAIIRSIALGIRQGARRRQGHEIFQRVDKALSWVTEGLPTRDQVPISLAPLVLALKTFKVSSQGNVAGR